MSQELSAMGYTFLGGVVGRSQATILGCSNSGTVTFTGKNTAQPLYIGGIVGTMVNASGDRISEGTTNSGDIIINSSTQSDVDVFVGGIAGRGRASASGSAFCRVRLRILQIRCHQFAVPQDKPPVDCYFGYYSTVE